MILALDSSATVSISPFEGTSVTVPYVIAAGETSPHLSAISLSLSPGANLVNAFGQPTSLSLPPGNLAASLIINPLPPSTISQLIVNATVIQRSRLTTVELIFSSPIDAAQLSRPGVISFSRTVGPSTIVVTGAIGPNGRVLVTPTTGVVTSVTLTFTNGDGSPASAGVEYGSLADGRWQLAIPWLSFATTLADENFRRLFGDSNNDGTVDGSDLAAFGAAFGLTTNNNPFDYNADGTIDAIDFGQFGNRFGLTL